MSPAVPAKPTAANSDAKTTRDRPDTKVEIAVLGSYLPYDETAEDERNPAWWRNRLDDKWQALCQTQGAVELVPTSMEMASEEVDGDKNGLIVSASRCAGAIVLIRGLPGSFGVVPTARLTQKLVPPPRVQDTTWELALLGSTWRLHFEDEVGLPLMVSSGARTQELRNWKDAAARLGEAGSVRHDWGFAGSVNILWGGDLNGDGQLDLLLKQGDAEIGVSVELFLSRGGSAAPQLILADTFAYGAC